MTVHLGQEKASSKPPWNQEMPLAPWRVPARSGVPRLEEPLDGRPG
jgi:hypothetical protein